MRYFRSIAAVTAISGSMLFALHESVAQSALNQLDNTAVKRVNLKYQSQSNLKQSTQTQAARRKLIAQNQTTQKQNSPITRRTAQPAQRRPLRPQAVKPNVDIIEPWPVNSVKTNLESTKKIKTVKPEGIMLGGTTFSGLVDFTVGEDTNIDPDKVGISDNFYEIAPSLSFKGKIFSGTIGASTRDYSEQAISNIAKKTTASASLIATVDFGQATSVTSLSGLYNDEMWPDFIDEDDDGLFDGMPIRYVEAQIDQKFQFKIGLLGLDVGGAYKRRDHTDTYSDYAPAVIGERRHEEDHNEIKGYSRLSLNAGKLIEFAVTPSISQKKYDNRLARMTDGSSPLGNAVTVPNYEIIKSDLALDVNFKFMGSTITPTGMVGQVADQVSGAEDNSYYGYGLKGNIVLVESLGLTLSPSIIYKQAEYDNWTYGSRTSREKRLDQDVTSSIALKAMFTKNFGAGIKYDQIREKSTAVDFTDENYRQQIFGTTLTLAF